MTDQAVICSFMQTKPLRMMPRDDGGREWWTPLWSTDSGWAYYPTTLDLDALREVQDRLTDEQWRRYYDALANECAARPSSLKFGMYDMIHATAEQKIRALAAVLRTPEVTDAATTLPHRGLPCRHCGRVLMEHDSLSFCTGQRVTQYEPEAPR